MTTTIRTALTSAAWDDLARRGVDTTALLANGLNHPTAEAHRVPAELVMKLIVPEFNVTVLEDDDGCMVVSVADPLAMFKIVDKPEMADMAGEVESALRKAFAAVKAEA